MAGIRPHPVEIRFQQRGFTLVELLVVIGIVALLMGLLLPALTTARRSAQNVQCISNVKQICAALQGYASDNRGFFPPNSAMLPAFWTDPERIGPWLPGAKPIGSWGLAGNVMACPADPELQRSYSMNFWASASGIPLSVTSGRFWKASDGPSTSLILVIEAWPMVGNTSSGYLARPDIGNAAAGVTPGQRFGGGAGQPAISPIGGRLASLVCYRHGTDGQSGHFREAGRVNIGYADSHVATVSCYDLVDPGTGRSTLDSLWSPLDSQLVPP